MTVRDFAEMGISKWDNLDYSSDEEEEDCSMMGMGCDMCGVGEPGGPISPMGDNNQHMMEYLMNPQRALIDYYQQHHHHQQQNQNKSSSNGSSPTHFPTFDTVFGSFNPATWQQWIRNTKFSKYEWLIDCYRLRCDDDYGRFQSLHGLYDAYLYNTWGAFDAFVLVKDLLRFCKLAVKQNMTQQWSWDDFIRQCEKDLMYAFEPEDAEEKYGDEFIFLTITADFIYQTAESFPQIDHTFDQKVGKKLGKRTKSSLFSEAASLFQDVGGNAVWKELVIKMDAASKQAI
jgi:hypothetical protein